MNAEVKGAGGPTLLLKRVEWNDGSFKPDWVRGHSQQQFKPHLLKWNHRKDNPRSVAGEAIHNR